MRANRTHTTLLCIAISLACMLGQDYVDSFNRLTDYNTPDNTKQELSAQLTQELATTLSTNPQQIDSLGIRQLKKTTSPDEQVTLYTWHYSLSNATSQYGGILAHKDNITPLTHNNKTPNSHEKYDSNSWLGGIYYDIIPIEIKGKTHYTLLSWDGNNGVTSKKIIDALSFDKRGRAIFGLPIFEEDRNTQHRVIIEYSSNTTLLLEYDTQKELIITNALFANESKYSDVTEYYSASDAFNIYRFEKQKWILYRNVDIRLDKKNSKALKSNGAKAKQGIE